ncbi:MULTISPECIES: hypothetical protein [unclassified Ectothiorhodospira]|uniref:hypothetical protein n=1 Tax=unclassified Ectothiorhodospira TaxID=2684909 RepID=UPI001EE86F04|nr:MULTISPECIES: hypothetical protein [unclassified Ectothiorhodospira]MCG5516483.1 hypothetical protein [Ectothiorhodospira sp. 9100]MCG5519525.1 hypothetical protein [Ectothiorhodospira sp. 9905]
MTQIQHREAWLLASREFDENRSESLWQRCLEQCHQDPNEAKAQYLNEAAVLYDQHLAQGRGEGTPHADGSGGVHRGRPPKRARIGLWARLKEPSLLNPVIAAIPLGLLALWIILGYIFAQTRPPFVAWGVLLALIYVPAAAIIGYTALFTLRYRLSESFRRQRAGEVEGLSLWAIVSVLLFGAISMYLVWAL